MVHTLFGTMIVLSIAYCVILLSLVFSVIERKQNNLAIKDLISQISILETNYANKITSINDSVLQSNNYVRVNNTTFAVRKDEIASYTVLYAH